MRHIALPVAVLFLAITVLACAHSGDVHHSRHCGICNLARLPADIPSATPVLHVLVVACEELLEPVAVKPSNPFQPHKPPRGPPFRPLA